MNNNNNNFDSSNLSNEDLNDSTASNTNTSNATNQYLNVTSQQQSQQFPSSISVAPVTSSTLTPSNLNTTRAKQQRKSESDITQNIINTQKQQSQTYQQQQSLNISPVHYPQHQPVTTLYKSNNVKSGPFAPKQNKSNNAAFKYSHEFSF